MSLLKIIFYCFIFPFVVKSQVVVGDSLSSTIIYNNIKDTVITVTPQGTKYYNVDLDSDNVNDIRFRISQSYSPGHLWENQSVRSLNGFEFVTLLTPLGYLDTLTLNSIIDSNLNWYSTPDSVILFNYSNVGSNTIVTGLFMRPNNYLGFRKILGNSTVYGWILIDASLYNGITIRSWAYKPQLSGIYEFRKEHTVLVYPNPASTKVSVAFANGYLPKSLKFYLLDINGKEVMECTLSESTGATTINTEQLPAGVYTIKINGDDKVFVKRLVVIK